MPVAPDRARAIDTIDHNLMFRMTSWLLTPWGWIAAIASSVVLNLVVVLYAGVKPGTAGYGWILVATIAAVVMSLLLPRISQAFRLIGPNRIPLRAIKRAVRRQRVRSPWFGYMRPAGIVAMLVLAAGILLALVAVSGLVDFNFPEYGDVSKFIGRTVLFTAVGLLAYVARHFLRSAEATLSISGAPPVVYLRSFGDDVGLTSDRGGGSYRETFEQMVSKVMRRYGPFMAIGRPGEGLPLLGAARTYQSDDAWQAHALKLMKAAKLIVLIVGSTGGLRWEVLQIVAHDWQDKLLILMPPLPNPERTRRLQTLDASLADSRWAHSLDGVDGNDLIGLRLEADGRSTLVKAVGYSGDRYLWGETVTIALHGLLCRRDPQV